MKVAVNLFLASPKSITGAFVYIQDILPALFRADPSTTYYLLGGTETVEYFRALYKDIPNVRFRIFDIRRDLFANPVRAIRKLLAKMRNDFETREAIIVAEVNAYIKKEGIGVYFSPSQTLFPRGLEQVKTVTTILDLQFDYLPENFPPSYLEKRRRDARYTVEHSDCLIAISHYTAKTLEEKYAASPSKMKVIWWAPHENTKGPSNNVEVPRNFVFYPAAIWPHKNHAVLIKALGILKDRSPQLHVVCTGVVKGKDLKGELEALAESEGVRERVLFMGFLPDEDLPSIYTRAKALVFPSAFEGFGLPLIEAMQFGVPVIAADNTSITEVVADAGILVPTGDAQALAQAIERVRSEEH